MEILRRKVLLGGIIGIVVIILLFVIFLYLPNIRRTTKIQSEVSSLKKQIKDNEAMAKDIVKLRSQVISLEEGQKEFMSKIIPRSELLSVIKQLVNIGTPFNLIFTEIKPPGLDTVIQADNPEAPLRPIPFLLTIQGRYLDLAQYIESLKEFPYFVRIPEVEIIAKEELRPMIEIQVLLNVYASSLIIGMSK